MDVDDDPFAPPSSEPPDSLTTALEDPLLKARVDAAIAPYEGRLAPEALAECRRMLTVLLLTDPEAAPLMERIRSHFDTNRSGVLTRGEPADLEPPAARRVGEQGRR
ncbi:MAG: hypothetical protein U0359_19025 [Byssovorax sp.]